VEPGRDVVAAEQRAVGHEELDLDRDRRRLRLAGHSLDQGVGHDLAAAAAVATCAEGVGVPGQRGVDRHALLHG
jgi:hypothetical protein